MERAGQWARQRTRRQIVAQRALTWLRRQGAWAALAVAMASHAAPAEPELSIEMSLLPDGALQVRYTPPPDVRELTFWNPIPGAHDAWRAAMMAPADACTELTRRTLRIHDSPACSAATVRVTPKLLALDASYQPAEALGNVDERGGQGGLLAYTGHYTALLPGHALRWRWVVPPGGYLVQAGATHAQAQVAVVEQLVSPATVDRSRVPSYVSVRALGAHQYVWWGRWAPEQLPEGAGSLVLDPRLDAVRAQRIRTALQGDMAALKAAYGRGPAGPVGVLVPLEESQRFHGDTTEGRMMRLQLPAMAGPTAMTGTRLERFVAHEVAHWWNAGVFYSDALRPWLHEGHAEWVALLLQHRAGREDDQAVRASVEAAINTCLQLRGDLPAAQLPLGFSDVDDPYACGLALMVLAQALHHTRATAAPTPGSALNELASLHLDNPALGVVGFARWADGPPSATGPDPMRQLLTDLNLGFASGYRALAKRTGLVSAEPVPATQRLRLAPDALARLGVVEPAPPRP